MSQIYLFYPKKRKVNKARTHTQTHRHTKNKRLKRKKAHQSNKNKAHNPVESLNSNHVCEIKKDNYCYSLNRNVHTLLNRTY